MYDLNLAVPNISSKKYSDDNKFFLLKNYLYELNDALAYALDDRVKGVVYSSNKNIKEESENAKKEILQLKEKSVADFNRIKEDIIRTADEIEKDYTLKITQSEKAITQSVGETYLTKSDFGTYKQSSDTQIQQNSQNITLNAENTEKVKTELNSFKDSSRSEMAIQSDEIMSKVESTYQSKDESADIVSKIYSEISQTQSGITENFGEEIKKLNSDISSVGGKVQELSSDLDVYIRRGLLEENVYGIEIGRSDSNVKARFTNDRLSFYQGANEVAYVSGSTLYITDAHILDYLKIGNQSEGYFLFDTTDNGLELRWLNG